MKTQIGKGVWVHYLLCKEKSLKALEEEVCTTLTKKCSLEKGLPFIKIPNTINLEGQMLGFSTTALINTQLLSEESITNQATQILALIKKRIASPAKINCHVYSVTHKYGIIETGRAEILKDKLRVLLKKEQIFALRKNFDRSLAFVQVVVLANRSVAVSILDVTEMELYHSLISPYIGGYHTVEDNKEAPSRAFKKILEAQDILGKYMGAGDVVVDLGASPGGWSYIARQQGADVIALDRSPLRKDLMADKQVTFIKADAFKYSPQKSIDWVISDIISIPERVIELVTYWVIEKRCTHFVFTIKFHGHENYMVLEKFKTLVKKCDYRVILKQLNVNKNEVTIMGSRI